MTRLIVIHHSCIPWRLPIWPTVTAWLLLDHIHAGEVATTIFWCVAIVCWVFTTTMVFNQRHRKLDGFGDFMEVQDGGE